MIKATKQIENFNRLQAWILYSIFLFFVNGIYAKDFEFRLSKEKIAKGEPLTIEFVASGSKHIQPVAKSFTEGKITAVYSGIVSETKIINLNATSFTILRFNLVYGKAGKYKVPPISVLVDGSKFTISDTYFEITDEVYQSSQPNHSPFGMFGNIFQEDVDSQMTEMDAKLRFQTSKSRVYIGEPIIGYFVFYYRNARKPHFERNPNESIRFPFFTSELLTGVKISFPDEVAIELDGKPVLFNAIPYNREIYALTPLKLGKFSIGSTKFDYTNSNRIHYLTHTIHSEPKSLEVMALPANAPKSFSGEVGELKLDTIYNGDKVQKGGPWNFEIKISGLGLCNNIKDPLIASIPKNFPGRIVNLSSHRNQKFTEIQDGIYGFKCDISFVYAVFLEGNSKPFSTEFSFFNPKLGKYVTLEIQFPKLFLDTKNIKSTEDDESEADFSNELQLSFQVYAIGLISILTLLGWGFYKFILLPKNNQLNTALKHIQMIAGTKSGLLLEKAFLQNGYSVDQAKFLRTIRDKYVDKKFTEVLSIIDEREKEILNEYFNLGVKNESSRDR